MLDELCDVGPPEVPGEEFESFETTVVSGRRVIVRLSKDVRLEILVVRNVNETVAQNESSGFESEGFEGRE